MMPATEWDRELIADFAAERARLRESEVMGIRGLAAAHETRLLGDITQMLPVAIAARRSNREDALVDALCRINCPGRGLRVQPRSPKRPFAENTATSPSAAARDSPLSAPAGGEEAPAAAPVLERVGMACGSNRLGYAGLVAHHHARYLDVRPGM
jgi:hypothetical protein